MVKVSAPGKVILSGEHASLYGQPSVIATIDKRTYISADRMDDCILVESAGYGDATFDIEEVRQTYQLSKDIWEECSHEKDFTKLKDFSKENHPILFNIIGGSLDLLNIDSGAYISMCSEIVPRAGLGSSSALSVAMPRALAGAYGKKLSIVENNTIAYELEKLNHGMASGGDNSACCFGGVILFQKENKKSVIEPLHIEDGLENFVIVYTKGREKNNVDLITNTDERSDRGKIMQQIGKISRTMANQLSDNYLTNMPVMMNTIHDHLSELGYSIPEADEINEAVRKIGGGAKMTGGGGGGYMICYHTNVDKLCEIISDLGYESEKVKLGVEGVRLENQ